MGEVERRRGLPAPEYLAVAAAAPGRLFPSPSARLSGRGIRVAVVSLIVSIVLVWYSRNTGREHAVVVRDPFLVAAFAFLLSIWVRLPVRGRMEQSVPVTAYTRNPPAIF